MNFQNPYLNPYMQPIQPVQQMIQPTQVVRVNGENGARAYQIGANSSALLLDESGLMVWLVVSDGAGYKTVTPYDITPHQAAPAPDFGSLESRIKRLEDMINGDTANTYTIKRRSKPDGDGEASKSHAWRNAEPSGGSDPDR